MEMRELESCARAGSGAGIPDGTGEIRVWLRSLAAPVCVVIAAWFFDLALYSRTVFKRLQNAAGTSNYFHARLDTAGDLNVGFPGDAGSYFDKSHLVVCFKQVNTLHALGLFAGDWS